LPAYQEADGVDVQGSTDKNQEQRPDDQERMEVFLLAREDAQTQLQKNGSLGQDREEGKDEKSQCLAFHGQVPVRVMPGEHACEEDADNTGELAGVGKEQGEGRQRRQERDRS
jgi:hypothetical protein